MAPYLELVGIQEQESFKIWEHGYPYETVRWHFHPEYELNLVTHTSGRCYVGDYTGSFEPGQLYLVGPNVPHNWISEVPGNNSIAERSLVLQFSGKSITSGIEAFPELSLLGGLLVKSQRGILFSKAISAKAAPMLQELMHAKGFARVHLFLQLLELLTMDLHSTLLASEQFRPDPAGYQSSTINQVMSYLAEHLSEPLSEADLARYAGMESGSFSRFFRRNTDVPFVKYLNRLRINKACEMLISSDTPVTEICYACGFNNVSNFNRKFLSQKGMAPSQFRRYYRLNADCEAVA